MIQISITSDVYASSLLVDTTLLENIEALHQSQISNNTIMTQINGDQLVALKSELGIKIEKLLSQPRPNSKSNVKSIFGGVVYDLDFRDRNDFYICFLIDFFDMISVSISLSGTVYIFNRDLAIFLNTDKIGAYLKGKISLAKKDILEGIVKLYSDSVLQSPFTNDTLDSGLDNMIKYGLATYNENRKTYKLTARGYMLF